MVSTSRSRRRHRSLLHYNNSLIVILLLCITICISLSIRIHNQLLQSSPANDTAKHKSTSSSTNKKHSNNHSTKGLSACLLVNDENPRLPEWLAYHYQILPLRSLIIAIDPSSRLSPDTILNRWTNDHTELGLDIQVWNDIDYLPLVDGLSGVTLHGPCQERRKKQNKATTKKDDEYDCLWHHRKRQRYFINKCMSTFKQQNKTYVLLTDVDEYITFNTIHTEDDPPLPLDVAPIDVLTLSNWKLKVYNMVDKQTGLAVKDVHVEGTISGLPSNNYTLSSSHHSGTKMIKNGDHITTGSLNTTNKLDYIQGVNGVQYGNVIVDEYGSKYYLRNDHAFRDAVQMKQAPLFGVPTMNNTYIKDGMLHGTIYNDDISNKKNGEHVVIKTNWKEYPPTLEGRASSSRMKNTLGGHLMTSIDRQTYYIQGEYELWPPHLSTYESMNIRRRLPNIGQGKTILDVLENEVKRLGNEYAQEVIGPCISMPRLLYGSYINNNDTTTTSSDGDMIPDGFSSLSFVTLKYRYHAIKEARINKFQKTIIDVSRIRMTTLKNHEAENIHVPLTYYCRKDPTRYSTSYFRVNHYLDSYEAYSYRNDARGSKRQCRECYDEKGREAAYAMNDDIRPWLKSFVESVGYEKAKHLLTGAGDFK